MLSRKRVQDLWVEAKSSSPPGLGMNVEEVVNFGRLVEAAALENAARERRYMSDLGWRVQLLTRARQARKAVEG